MSHEDLAARAVEALLDELEVFPKPGLVSRVDSGAHRDMDHALMTVSALALAEPFCAIAEAGARGGGFGEALVPLGIEAERAMMRATGGVNTHRGAIFTLGLLVASVARAGATGTSPRTDDIRRTLLGAWGGDLRRHALAADAASHGSLVRQSSGLGGVRDEAAAGFPLVFDLALPHLREAANAGLSANAARVETIFVLMRAAADTNVFYRGGESAAAHVRASAKNFLAAGGCRTSGWQARAEAVHRDFTARNISPGGCADLLAAALFIDAVASP